MHDYNHELSPETGLLVKEAALAAMGAWVAAIANNIKNPVAGIGAAIEILTRDIERASRLPGAKLEGSLETITRIKTRLAMMDEYVTELVDFAKPPQVRPQEVELLRIVNIVRDTIASYGFDPAIIEESLHPDCQVVKADSGRLSLILKSLVMNGIEAVGSGKTVRIRIAAERQTVGATKGVLLSVEDNGPGFFEKIVTHIFDPFFSTKEASTGLGLTLVKKYVDAHGGTIMISSSRLLGGAKIELFFPD